MLFSSSSSSSSSANPTPPTPQKAKESARELIQQSIAPHYREWLHTVVVHKAVAHNLNCLQLRAHSAVGVAWVPTCRLPEVKQSLGIGGSRADTVLMEIQTPAHVMPPTYFRTNFFTETFQNIVNAYGAPRYKEINPAVFTMITFPWLFGVMYGDIGHGIIITLAAAAFIFYEKKLGSMALNEMVEMAFGARYLLLLMGLFATYYGFLYNDCFGLMFKYSSGGLPELVNSTRIPEKWNPLVDGPYIRQTLPGCEKPDPTHGTLNYTCGICGRDPLENKGFFIEYEGYAPAFGVDVAWTDGTKRLDVYNSFKMKSAIVIGVCQMMLGLVLQFMNNKYFNDWKHIYFGTIPEVIFLSCTFGYMALLIVLKWILPFQTSCRVSLLETMVNFFLNPTEIVELYSGQIGLQCFFLLVALICVCPFMLFPIPYIEWKADQERTGGAGGGHSRLHDDDDEEEIELIQRGGHTVQVQGGGDSDDLVGIIFPPKEYAFDMQEIVIKQIIHAIEFVLGSVSNTASYLRLWALSLAHAQLSEVFLNFLIMAPLEKGGTGFSAVIMWMLGFSAWLTATLMILVGMEALSAFLHALRLHWVEFQNKFYIADGNLFLPLDLSELRREADEELRM